MAIQKSVLVITLRAPLYRRVEQILGAYKKRFDLIAQIDNSVVAESVMKEIRPQIVLVSQKIHFWDAEHLIHDEEIEHIPVQYIVIGNDAQKMSQMVENDAAVSAGLIENEFTKAQLLDAMVLAERDWEKRFGGKTSRYTMQTPGKAKKKAESKGIKQASAEEKESFAELSDMVLSLENSKVWVLTAACIDEIKRDTFHFYAKISKLIGKLDALLNNYGHSTVSVLQNNQFCIMIEQSDASRKMDWDFLCMQINTVMDYLEYPKVILDICDEPVELGDVKQTLLELEELREYRFFVGDKPVLQKMWIKENRIEVRENELEPLFDKLRQSMYSLDEDMVHKTIEDITQRLYHSFSIDLVFHARDVFSMMYATLAKIYQINRVDLSPSIYKTDFASLSDFEDTAMNQFGSLIGVIKSQEKNSGSVIAIAVAYMVEHLDEHLTLEGVAKSVHLSPSHLSRMFKVKTGETFVDLLTRKRIERAKELLRSSLKVGDVSSMVGYENSKYFSQVFKKTVGMTPKEYRQMENIDEKADV